ncbi:glycosyltransferase family 39 protein [Agrobacterium larrymoorei]|uniref:glycosyltransferase family 39 protein n=1 Tax=Agrobacterium larrymoorei TaxID=160699 RepID=UPI001573F254|nr:glycosyltransferase family 39 protein [Agrobacterium larrymoorei]NTJ41938.1 glycosyltransferase family 39 protein [Agrobacterium larrymoorei]
MRKALSRNPDVVMVTIAGYFLLAIIFRTIRSPALEVDETQQALFAQYLLLGYGSQPPLYTWLQYGLNEIIGASIASLSILKNGLLFLSCLFYWLTARLLMPEDRALPNIATLGILTLPPVFVMSQRDLSHTVLALFAVSLFLYGFVRTLKQPSLAGYVLTGIAIGIGGLAKYNFIPIPLAAIIAILPEKDLRARLLDWRLLLTIVIAGVVVSPHGLWMWENLHIATAQTLGEMKEGSEQIKFDRLDGSKDLVLAAIKGIALTTAIFAAIFYKNIREIISASDQWTKVFGRILLISFAIVLLVVVLVGVTHIRQKWLAVYIALLPLYLALKIRASGIDAMPKLGSMLAVTAVLAVGFITVLLGRGLITPHFERYSLVHIPYDRFGEAVRREGHTEPQYVIASGGLVGGNLKMQFPKALVLTGNRDVETFPAQLPQGATVLFAGTSNEGQRLDDPGAALNSLAARASLPAPTEIRNIEVPYAGAGGKRHSFYYAWETIGLK